MFTHVDMVSDSDVETSLNVCPPPPLAPKLHTNGISNPPPADAFQVELDELLDDAHDKLYIDSNKLLVNVCSDEEVSIFTTAPLRFHCASCHAIH